MGGPRASTMRQIAAGRRCYRCSRAIDTPPWQRGERLCDACAPRYSAYMHIGRYKGWWDVSFSLLPDQKLLARKLNFRDKEKILELARRTRASDEVMAELERTLRAWGQGTITLSLTSEQVTALGGVLNRRK